jgi:hypothetical protein
LIVACIVRESLASDGPFPPTTQERGPDEYDVKVACLAKITEYVIWPKEAFGDDKSPLIVGVFGRDPFGSRLDETFKGRHFGSHPIAIRRCADLDATLGCHLLFVAAAQSDKLAKLLELHKTEPTLFVGESTDFAERGGCIGFYFNEQKKVRFAINQRVAKNSAFKLSADLMKLGKPVSDKEPDR